MSRQVWLAALAVASCVCGASALADEPRPRTVNVSGMAEVSAAPDLARVVLGVESRKPTMEPARAEVAATVDRVLALARDLKIDVPRKLSVTGFDDISLANLVVPRLTTIRQPADMLARRAVGLLLEEPSSTDDEMVDGSLIVRGSSGPCPQPKPDTPRHRN